MTQDPAIAEALDRAADDGWPEPPASAHEQGTNSHGDFTMNNWEYLIAALPRFEAPTDSPSSPAVRALNDLGEDGWEAVGMTVLAGENVAVLLKRPAQAKTGSV